jgi:hypothetical protein
MPRIADGFGLFASSGRHLVQQPVRRELSRTSSQPSNEITEIADQADGMHRIHTGLYEDDKFLC